MEFSRRPELGMDAPHCWHGGRGLWGHPILPLAVDRYLPNLTTHNERHASPKEWLPSHIDATICFDVSS